MNENKSQSVFGGTGSVTESIEEKVQSKYTKRFYSLCLVVVLLIATVVSVAYTIGRKDKDNRDYKDAKYQLREKSDISKILSVETGMYYLVFYSDTCSVCETIKPTVLNYIDSDSGYNHNLYISSIEAPIVNDYDINSLVGVNSYLEFKMNGYPTMIEVNNGTITGAWEGTTIVSQLMS